MKFGKRLESSVNAEWRTQFIDYRAMKKVLKRIKNASNVEDSEFDYDLAEDRGIFLNKTIENPDLANNKQCRLFIEKCQTELNKINKFFVQQEKKIAERQAQLKAQTTELVQFFIFFIFA